MSRQELHSILPHRSPILLVDSVTELQPGRCLSARRRISASEPWYQGPGAQAQEDDAYPEVLLIESWCQAAGVLVAHDTPNPDVLSGQVMLFGGMSGVEVLGAVHPGDVLDHEVVLVRTFSDMVIVSGSSRVGPRTVLRLERVVMAMRDASDLSPPAPPTVRSST